MERLEGTFAPESNPNNRTEESPREEWEIERMRPSGPGGQHMQKTESKVRVRWNFEAATDLSEEEKARLREKFPEGYIEAVSQETRFQRKNLWIAQENIADIREETLAPRKERVQTAIPKTAREERLTEKRRISEKKAARKRIEIRK